MPDFQLAKAQGDILREIANPATDRLAVARTYRRILDDGDEFRVDWLTVNSAIRGRWSLKGLNFIKEQVWSGKPLGESR